MGSDNGESIEMIDGLSLIVSLIISSSVEIRLVVALLCSNRAHPEGLFSDPVKSIPTILWLLKLGNWSILIVGPRLPV